MFDIITIQGGLGNQMFCYAFTLSRIKIKKHIYLLKIDSTVNRHYGLEIFSVFHTTGKWRVSLFNFLNKYLSRWLGSFKTITQNNAIYFYSKIQSIDQSCIHYYGYWQSELYFKDVIKRVKREFRFRDNMISAINRQLAIILNKVNSVSIHIRRGDYLNEDDWNISNTDYYSNAIAHINKKITTPSYYIFSDDIEWCRDRFKGSQYHFVDWNKGSDSWQDMYLMSCCKHNIIANSTFSWWGAWLNNNESKIVIAPEVWFPNMKSSDIIPHDWITISIK